MLSDQTLRAFIFFVRVSSYFNGSPFIWCSKQRQLLVTKHSRYRFCIGMAFLHYYLLHLSATFSLEFSSGKPELESLPLAFGTFMMSICTLMVMYNMAFQAETMIYYFNAFVLYCHRFKERYVHKGKPARKTGCEDLFSIFFLGTVMFSLGYVLFFLENPTQKMFITSPLAGYLDAKMLFILAVVLTPFLFFIVFGVCTALALNLLVFVVPLFVMNTISKEMMPRKSSGKAYFTNHHLRKPYNIICVYRAITIFKILINQIVGRIFLPIEIVLSYCIVICNFCLINFSSHLDIKALMIVIGLSLTCLFVWVVTLWFAGMAFKISNSRIKSLAKYSWPNENGFQKNYAKTALKSFRPVYMKAGGFYIVQLVRTLKFINFVIWATMKTLLMYNTSV